MSVEPCPRSFERGEPVPPPPIFWVCETQPGPSRAPEASGLLRRWLNRVMHRRALARLVQTQPDSVLADVGLTRADAIYEAEKPFWRP